MSIERLGYTMERIKVATQESPLAVFTSQLPRCCNSMFANSVTVRKLIERNPPAFIGVYHNGMNLRKVELEIKQAIAVADAKRIAERSAS